METTDWQNIIAGGMAISLVIGGLFMMFTDVFTSKKKR